MRLDKLVSHELDLEAVVGRFYASLYRFALSLTKNEAEAGDLTQQTDYPGGSAAARVTQNWFDWRDRVVASKPGVQASEDPAAPADRSAHSLNDHRGTHQNHLPH